MINLGDDVGMQDRLLLSKETWRQRLKPRLRRVIDAIREASGNRKVWVHYHSDGDVTPLIDDLIEIGVDILNPVQPECMNLESVADQYQARLALRELMAPQTPFRSGPPAKGRGPVNRSGTR